MTTPGRAARAAKIAISLPHEQLEYLRAAEQAGRGSVSGHIQQLIQREREAADVEHTLRRLFGTREQPTAEHEAWARRALGIEEPAETGAGTAHERGAGGTGA
ncbi:hypothetical protein ACTWP5_03725 [Streptomyces sp. 4N509B]|uniref:hypothetical protein n=1 Tax=Streptomyces sp. 4N509B TaxID=3457413 RepID=UPI003FCEF56D